MKQGIHPNYHKAAVQCACGTSFEVGSTQKKLDIEICSKCHPFYTGEKNILDSTGRVDRFKRMQEKKETMTKTKKSAKGTKAAKAKKSQKLTDLKNK